MSRFPKLALILLIGLVAIGARDIVAPPQDLAVEPATAHLPEPQDAARTDETQPQWTTDGNDWLYRPL